MLCPSPCGGERPADAPGGLCPRCVLRRAMESETAPRGPGTSLSTLGRGSASPTRMRPSPAPTRSTRPRCRRSPATPPTSSCSARSPAAAWAPCSRAATPTSAATSPSRSCSSRTGTSPTWPAASSRRRRSPASSSIPGVVPVYELGAFADRRPYLRHEAGQGPHAGGPAGRADRPGRRPAPVRRRSSSRSAGRWPTPTPAA